MKPIPKYQGFVLVIVEPQRYEELFIYRNWDLTFQNGTFAGTRGESRRLEGFSLLIDDQTPDLGVRYMAHVQNTGDTPWVNDGKFIGTKGESLRLEGFAIQLTGKASVDYNIFYACHLQNLGDTQIRSNGDFCGTRGSLDG